jgi:4-amino-4-deoxy-L-arabinose transferase-like glycosyltransferase
MRSLKNIRFALPSAWVMSMVASARRDLLWLVPLFAIYFAFLLGGRALWSPVEGRYAEIAREMVVSGDYVAPRLNGVKYFEKPPLFYWLEAVSIKLFGLHEWSLRLWPAIFAVLGCLAVYAFGASLFDRRTGLIAAIVLATSPLYYALGRVVAVDVAFTFFLSVGLLAFLFALRRPPDKQRRVFMGSFYAAIALATLTKGLLGILLPGLVIGVWMSFRNEWRNVNQMHLLSGLAIFLLIAAPWHIAVAIKNPDFASFYFLQGHLDRYITAEEGGLREAWIYIPVLLIAFFPWIALAPESFRDFKWRSRGVDDAGLFLGLWVIVVFVFFSLAGSRLFTYVLPIIPPLALLIGRTFSRLWDDDDAPRGILYGAWAVLAALLLMIATAWLIAPEHGLERYSNWPSLAPPRDDTTIPSLAARRPADLDRLRSYVNAQMSIVIFGAATVLIFVRRQSIRGIFVSLTVMIALLLIAIDSSLPLLDDRRSVKALALAIKQELAPNEEVVSYHAYYQDLPVYLERIVTVVGWRGELDFGARAEDTRGWMIDDVEFRRRWSADRRMYVFTERESYEKMKAQLPQVYPVAANNYNVVVSNREYNGGKTP